MKLQTLTVRGALLALLVALFAVGTMGIGVSADNYFVQCTTEGCPLPDDGDQTNDNFTVNGTEFDDDITTYDLTDIVFGNAGCDSITTDGGDDLVFGGPGDDTIDTGDGNDRVWPGPADGLCPAGGDVVTTGEGDDKVTIALGEVANGAFSTIDCGPGDDQVNFLGFGTNIMLGTPNDLIVTDPSTGGEIFVDANCEILNGLGDLVEDAPE